MNLAPASISALASSPETSFWVALGRATSTLPTCIHGRAFSMYLNLPEKGDDEARPAICLRSTLVLAMMEISSGENPSWPVATRAPLLSDRETTVPPNSITLRAANCATLPDPEMATRFPANDSLPPVAYWIMWFTYYLNG